MRDNLRAMTCVRPLALFVLASAAAACGDEQTGPRIEDVPLAEELRLPGLQDRVEVVYDERGVPHIYAANTHDALMAQGYLMAVDRFGQMEFVRRLVLGRLAEVAGPDLLARDIENRHAGYARLGRAIYESFSPGDESRLFAEAFVEGINAYIDRVMRGEVDPVVRGAETLGLIVTSPFFGHWDPADIFAMARFQAANLSYDAEPEVRRSYLLAAVRAAFPADSADPRRAARAGFFSDMFGEWPARAVFTRDGFNDGSSSALLPPDLAGGGGVRPLPAPWLPSLRSLRGALDWLERREAAAEAIFGDADSRGSNNWVVAGTHTASGFPLLANDPHLSLTSPPVFWFVHLNTIRFGGPGGFDVEGLAFAGLPGVILGYNRDIAWGATTTGYDVTDVYEEQLTGSCDELGNVTGGTVRFQDRDVSVAFYEEVLHVRDERDPAGMTVRLPYVPHHGLFIPQSCAPIAGMPGRFTALSVRYTGDEISNELAFFIGLARATSVAEARAAQDAFRVGSQNWVVIDRQSIQWSTESRIPVRDPRAMTFAIDERGVPTGHCPHLVLPGTGDYEWIGDLDERYIPHDVDPERGWVATANQDNVGVTADGNPCNDAHYVGANFDYGWREFRIVERLTELVARGAITVEDMVGLQAETQSQLGRTLRDPIVAILERPTDAIPDLSERDRMRLADARMRLAAWTLETPSGVGASDPQEIADSIATSIFNAALSRILPLAFDDELAEIGAGGSNANGTRLLEWALTNPNRLYTYDRAIADTVLWDDLRTEDVTETRAQIVIRGVLAGLDFLETRLGPNPDAWRWGRLHTVRFRSIVPPLGTDILSIPPADDPMYPDGFPRHGDMWAVDACNFGLWNGSNFSYGSGPVQRLVVEMSPEGPRAFNAIPGGQSIDPESRHKADEAVHWVRNEQPPMFFREPDVVMHAERRIRLVP
jgi:penicillin amidase